MIIVIGRGHSGTSLIAGLLHANGVFMGDKLNKTYDWLGESGRYGEHIARYHDVCRRFNKETTANCSDGFIRLLSDKPSIIDICDVASYLRPILTHSEPCGFKLPESIFILPLLIQLFPDAKYILNSRSLEGNIKKSHTTDNLARWGLWETTPSESWEYQNSLIDYCKDVYDFDHHHVRYDDICIDPHGEVAALGQFIGIDLKENANGFEIRKPGCVLNETL